MTLPALNDMLKALSRRILRFPAGLDGEDTMSIRTLFSFVSVPMSLAILMAVALPPAVAQQPPATPDASRRGPLPPTLQEQGTQPGVYYEENYYYEEEEPTPIPMTFEQMIEQQGSTFGKIERVLSGNLYELENEYRIQLLGVKPLSNEQALQGDPNVNQQLFEYSKRIFIGHPIQLRFEGVPDLSAFALPVYALLPGGRLLNEEIVKEGFGTFDPAAIVPEKIMERLKRAQIVAQRRKLGIWAMENTPEKIVEGPVLAAPVSQSQATEEAVLENTPVPLPAPVELPDTLILTSGERMMGKIEGNAEAAYVTLRTADGNLISISRERIAEIQRE